MVGAVRPAGRRRGLPWLTAGTAVVAVLLLLAVRSGNALADGADGRAINGDITAHRTLGNQTLIISLVWIAGLVGAKGGVLPATLTHGGTIFLLSSGLF